MERIVLGTLHLRRLGPEPAYRLLDAFVAAGGTAIDTAGFYGSGYVEQLVGAWLRRARPEVSVTTKLGYFRDPRHYQQPARIRQATQRCFDRLGTIPRTILLHEADWACWWSTHARPGDLGAPPAREVVPAWTQLCELADEFGFTVGVSGNNAEIVRSAARTLGADDILVAKQYDLLWRNAEPLVADPGPRVTLGAPFHQGHLLDLPRLAARAAANGDSEMATAAWRIAAILNRHSLRPQDAAVPFLLGSTAAAAVCVGISDEREIRALRRAVHRTLDPELLRELRACGLLRPPIPGVAHLPGLPAAGTGHPGHEVMDTAATALLRKDGGRHVRQALPEASLRHPGVDGGPHGHLPRARVSRGHG